jgi:hypothetical protein
MRGLKSANQEVIGSPLAACTHARATCAAAAGIYFTKA